MKPVTDPTPAPAPDPEPTPTPAPEAAPSSAADVAKWRKAAMLPRIEALVPKVGPVTAKALADILDGQHADVLETMLPALEGGTVLKTTQAMSQQITNLQPVATAEMTQAAVSAMAAKIAASIK